MAKITKQQIIERIAEHDTFETKRAAAEVFDIIIDTVIEAVTKGEEVHFGNNFGTFKPAILPARSGEAMGVKYSVPARSGIKFKPSSALKDALANA